MGPKHVEFRQYINTIKIVTSVGFYSTQQNVYADTQQNVYVDT